jgi:hypothetical protein
VPGFFSSRTSAAPLSSPFSTLRGNWTSSQASGSNLTATKAGVPHYFVCWTRFFLRLCFCATANT